MRILFLHWVLFLILPLSLLSQDNVSSLYHSVDPQSVSQNLAFYKLYPDTPQGKASLKRAWFLLNPNAKTSIPPLSVDFLAAIINNQDDDKFDNLSERELKLVESLGKDLKNRCLKGYSATNRDEILALPPEEIDLARALLISQSEKTPQQTQKYEIALDLMALQIRAKLPKHPTTEDILRGITQFVFYEQGFRFPPHSQWVDAVDFYTFLSSVLDSRRGICLGVSTLYICIAQRLGLSMEMITPPGHIYVRHGNTNIETTMRGVCLPSEVYLGVNTRKLQERNVKEVIGLTFMNQASLYMQQGDYPKAVNIYREALDFLPDDPLLKKFLAFAYILAGHKETGSKLLREIKNQIPDYAISEDHLVEDYLNGNVDAEGVAILFQPVDETRSSLLDKKHVVEGVLKNHPKFHDGYMQLAVLWLQLGREKEALKALQQSHDLEADDVTCEYYLAALYYERLDYPKAWEHLKQAEELAAKRDHNPRALKELRQALTVASPE